VNSLIDNIEHDEEEHSGRGADREITLGTTMILLIFFALAVYGAVLFGFGYSLGSKHSAPVVAAAPAASPSSNFAGFLKPSPASKLGVAAESPAPSDAKPVPYTPPSAQAVTKTVPVDPDSSIVTTAAPHEPAPILRVAPSASAPASTAVAAMPAVVPNATIVVQVAAVSHQEDAELIASTLQRRGYTVNIRTEPDKLLHVQVGPFATRKDAEAMKARLLGDGFNAYIK
jgi:cell division septation protein DedD